MNLYSLLEMNTSFSDNDTVVAVGGSRERRPDVSIAEATKNYSVHETCVQSLEEPDVTVVVGGKEFREYRQALRCWSGYFDVAFRSGMKETQSKRFEFPNRNPAEWEWIVSLMAPMSRERLTM